MKYSVGDSVYLAYGTTPYEIIDVIGTTYFLKAAYPDDYSREFHTHQTNEENTVNSRTIYERLEELEKCERD